MMAFRAVGDKDGAAPLPASALTEAVHVFFDRMNLSLPVYVSPMPAMRLSLIISTVILILGLYVVRYAYLYHKDAENPVKRFQYVIMLAVVLAVTNMTREFLFERIFHWGLGGMPGLYRENTQHLANMHWLNLYAKAIKV
jgi:hypothetical protein